MPQYKIDTPIRIRYVAKDYQSGITDLELLITKPNGTTLSPISMPEIDDGSGYSTTGIYETTYTPDVVGWYWIRIRSMSYPKNKDSRNYFVGTEFTTYPTQEDGNIQEINNKLGEVQASPTTYTLLARLKDIWDKLVSLFDNGLAKIKLWDGTEVANVTADNKLETITHGRGKCSTLNSTDTPLLAGGIYQGTWEEVLDYSQIVISIKTDQDSATDGLMIEWSRDGIVANTNDKFNIIANLEKKFSFGTISKYYRIKYINNAINPQSSFMLNTVLKSFNTKTAHYRISDDIVGDEGVELIKSVLAGKSDGIYKNVKVTSDGRLEVAFTPALTNISVQLLHDRQHTAINSGEWQEVLNYIVPIDYNLNVIAFEAQSQTANEAARAIYKNIMGTFNCSTNTFTDGNNITLPRFATRLYAYVTTDIGSGVNDTFTITYTNAMGVTGRTANITIAKSSLAGTRLEVPLQTGDRGIIDITNITHSATGQAGAVQFGGYIELLYLTLTSSNTQYQTASIPLGSQVVLEGETIYLQYLSSTKTTYVRRLNLSTALVPK